MKKLVILLSFLLCSLAYAKDASVVKTTGKVIVVDSSKAKLDGSFTVKEIIGEAKEVIEKAKQAQSSTNDEGQQIPKLMAIAALLAAIFKILLSLLKVLSKWFKTDTGKTVLRLSTVILGFLTFLVSDLALGIPWTQSLLLAAAGPGSLVIHELSLLIPWLKSFKEVLPVSGEVKEDTDKTPVG